MKKISVIVPIYNVEQYLKECIDSILNQTYKNIEVILVNDESPDECDKICEYYKERDERIKIINKKNGGLSSARNTGLKVATGDYISFIDSDDFLINNDAYRVMVDIIEKNKSDLVHGNAIKFYSNENTTIFNKFDEKKVFKFDTIEADEFLLKCLKNKIIYVPVWLNLYKRDLLVNNNIFFKEGIYHEDEEFSPRVLFVADRVSIYKEAFYGYRQRENSIMAIHNKKRGEDIIKIAELLDPYCSQIKNEEIRYYFSENLINLVISQIYKYKLKLNKKQIEVLKRNAYKKSLGIRLRVKLLSVNINVYLLVESIYKKIRA